MRDRCCFDCNVVIEARGRKTWSGPFGPGVHRGSRDNRQLGCGGGDSRADRGPLRGPRLVRKRLAIVAKECNKMGWENRGRDLGSISKN